MTNTPNYQLPLYAESDAPNLISGYNAAMTKIDTQMKTIADDVSSAGEPTSDDDPVITVAQLANLKVNANGFVYYKE